MEPAEIRAYQRQLLLFCLGIHGESTAAEALELMGNAALESGAPREVMLLSTAAAAGLLRGSTGMAWCAGARTATAAATGDRWRRGLRLRPAA